MRQGSLRGASANWLYVGITQLGAGARSGQLLVPSLLVIGACGRGWFDVLPVDASVCSQASPWMAEDFEGSLELVNFRSGGLPTTMVRGFSQAWTEVVDATITNTQSWPPGGSSLVLEHSNRLEWYPRLTMAFDVAIDELYLRAYVYLSEDFALPATLGLVNVMFESGTMLIATTRATHDQVVLFHAFGESVRETDRSLSPGRWTYLEYRIDTTTGTVERWTRTLGVGTLAHELVATGWPFEGKIAGVQFEPSYNNTPANMPAAPGSLHHLDSLAFGTTRVGEACP